MILAAGFFLSAALPLVEATTLTHLGEHTGRYGAIRLWGSIGYIVAVVGVGYALDFFPVRALLRIDGVRIVVASDKPQMADQELYRFIGVEPTGEKILVNKSSVHFRADFAPIAQEILVAKAPGPMLADPSEYAWKRLALGIRQKPRRPAFAFKP